MHARRELDHHLGTQVQQRWPNAEMFFLFENTLTIYAKLYEQAGAIVEISPVANLPAVREAPTYAAEDGSK